MSMVQALSPSASLGGPSARWGTSTRRHSHVASATSTTDRGTDNERTQLKQQLLELANAKDRGASATPEDTETFEKLFSQLEQLNPTPKPLKSNLSNGKWELKYTTSQGILGTSRPAILRPRGKIFQFIDIPNARARNQETFPLWNAVDAELSPQSDSYTNVKFSYFFLLNFIPIKAPDSARGALDFTYVDETMRLCRGDKSNLFVLTKVDDSRG